MRCLRLRYNRQHHHATPKVDTPPMSMSLSAAAIRTYDELKQRPNARPRQSDARDLQTLEAVTGRLKELIGSYRLGAHLRPGGRTEVFWIEIRPLIDSGAFDDLLHGL